MVRTNNRSREISNATDYFIADIEYAETDGISARFDMVALKWLAKSEIRKDVNKPSLAFIELKYGDDALNSSAGIEKHLRDLDAFISDSAKMDALSRDMTKVFRQKCRLGLVEGLQEKKYDLTISAHDPEVILVFAEHKPGSKVLKRILGAIHPEDYHFPILVASASMMGCGLYADCIESIEHFLQR